MGQVLLSPVDGSYPFDDTASYVITPGEKVSYTIPTVQIVNGFDPIPSRKCELNQIKKKMLVLHFLYVLQP